MTYEYSCKVCFGTLRVERDPGGEMADCERDLECPACGGRLRRLYTTSIVVPEGFRAH